MFDQIGSWSQQNEHFCNILRGQKKIEKQIIDHAFGSVEN